VVDWSLAALEIESMLLAQWRSGMVPHVHYDPAHLRDYFPGPDWWPGTDGLVRRPGELTSGISNPPVLAIAARIVGDRQPDPALRLDFWRRVHQPLVAWVRYLLHDRRLPGSPLVAVVHPWETGWDNSPRWDFLGPAGLRPKRPYERLDTRAVAAGQRPSGRDYDSYLALTEIISEGGYDLSAYRSRTPFVVHDVLFDALTYRAAADLDAVALALGETEPFGWALLAEFRRAFEYHHWNAGRGTYFDYDAQAGRQLEVASAAAVAALAGGLIPAGRVRAVLDGHLARSGGALPICTVPPTESSFVSDLYWRGPVWMNVNWLAIDGLRAAGLEEEAQELAGRTLAMFGPTGFAEYVDAIDGAGKGIASFSWTAALTLDLLGAPPRA